MAVLPTLYPNSALANTGIWTNEAGIPDDLHLLIDETGAAGTDYIRTGTSGGPYDYTVGVTDTPVDFATMNSLQIEVRHSRGSVEGGSAGAGDDTWTLFAYITNAAGTVALAGANSTPGNGQQIHSAATGWAPRTDTVSFAFVNTTADKTAWDGARLTIEAVFAQNMGGDGHRVWVDYVRLVNGDYDTGAPPPNSGSTSGAVSWAGSVTGARASSGSTSGAVSWVGSVTGARASSGTADGSISWVGSVTGEAPVQVNDGSVSGAISWAGSVTGAAVHSGSTSGSIGWSGSISGVSEHSGDTTGAVSWVGSVTGAVAHQGSTSGAISWTGTVDGVSPAVGVNDGSTSGSITWVGTVDGVAPVIPAHEGSVSGSIAWVGSVTGESPAVGVNDGSVSGAIGWAGTVTGTSDYQGSTTGTITWDGTVSGTTLRTGTADGVITWTGTVTGTIPITVPFSLSMGTQVTGVEAGGGAFAIEGGP